MRKKDKNKKQRKAWPFVLTGFMVVVLSLYSITAFTDIRPFCTIRDRWIDTAMTTMNHKWLAGVFPSFVVDEVMSRQASAERIQNDVSSNWQRPNISWAHANENTRLLYDILHEEDSNKEVQAEDLYEPITLALPEEVAESKDVEPIAEEKEEIAECDLDCEEFYELFYQIDPVSMGEFREAYPDCFANGWMQLDVNQSCLDQYGTSIYTTNGDQVLAIDAPNGILLIRVYVEGARGVMAIGKYTWNLSLCPASTLGSCGQKVGEICENNGGILAITGSAFLDDGTSNGGDISGLAVCNGRQYGSRLGGSAKRIELRTDHRMYIVSSGSAVDPSTRDASEFYPALICDGSIVVNEECGWNGFNPRAALGQTWYGESMMVVIEGRLIDSLGCGVTALAKKMSSYGCAQAMNLDGGTSAMMYYKGAYITRCSNTDLQDVGGRGVPTAWVMASN